MSRPSESFEPAIDEYMWPLTGESTAFNWTALTEEIELRSRLGTILVHVRETHIAPRIRRLGPRPSADQIRAAEASVISGPAAGPLWEQVLREPVPRALREEWQVLTRRLSLIVARTETPPTSHR